MVLQSFEEVWSKLNKWIPRAGPLKGVEVASVDHFLHKAGYARQYASQKVSCLKSGGIAGVDNTQKCHSRRLAKAGRQASRRSEQYIRTCGISALQHSFYDSRLGRCRCSCRCRCRCRCLAAGREVEVTAGTLAPGGRCNGFDWYVYGSSEKIFGWMPIAVLSSRTFQSRSH